MNIFTLTGEVLLKGTNEAINELRRLEEQADATSRKLSELTIDLDRRFGALGNTMVNTMVSVNQSMTQINSVAQSSMTSIVNNVNNVNNGLAKTNTSAKTFESDFSKTMRRLGKTLLAVFSAREIIGFAKDVTEASAEVTAEIVAFKQILGEYADIAKTKMEEMAETAGIVSTRLTPHMTNLTAKFKGLGFEVDEATDLAVRGLQMATDASAFWDISLEQSMEHMKSFLNGNYEGGEAIGLFANETQMAYYGIEKGLIKSRKAWIHLNEAVKQAIRLEFAEKTFREAEIMGHAARESEFYANVLANLKESFRQLKASIGDSYLIDLLIPAMKSLQRTFEDINEEVEEFNAWLENNEVLKHFSELWTKVSTEVGISIGMIKYQLGELWDWIVEESAISPLIKPIVDWSSNVSDNFVKALKGEIGWDEVFPDDAPKIIKMIFELANDTITALEDGDWATLTKNVLTVVSLPIGLHLATDAASGLVEGIAKSVGLKLTGAGATAGTVGATAGGMSAGGALAAGLLGVASIGIILEEVEDEGLSWEKTGADIVAALATGLGLAALGVNPLLGITIPLMVAASDVGEKVVDWAKTRNAEKNGVNVQDKSNYGGKPVVFDFNSKDIENAKPIVAAYEHNMGLQESPINRDIVSQLGYLYNHNESFKNILGEMFSKLEVDPNHLENMTREQVRIIVDTLNEKLGSSLQFEFPDDMVEKAEETGKQVVEGFEIGLEAAELVGQHFAEKYLVGTRHTLEVKSPSKVMEEIGNFVIQGFELGIDGAYTLGNNFGNEFIKGVKDSLDINSPSEEAVKIAEFFNAGLEQGFSSEDLGEEYAEEFLSGIYNLLDTHTYGEVTGLVGEALGAGLLSPNARPLVSEMLQYAVNNPRTSETPPNDDGSKDVPKITFWDKVKEFIDAQNEKVDESKQKFGEYINWIKDKFEDASNFISGFIGDINALNFNKLEAELSKLEKGMVTLEDGSTSTLKDEEKKMLKQLEDNEITYAEFSERKKELEIKNEEEILKKKNELEEKKFNAQKGNNLANALIDFASGSMKVWSEYATQPLLAISLTSLLAAQLGIQHAAIAAQEFVPLLAKGGIIDSATHAIIGEDGREAVVPLERNLEWVDGLARAMSPAINSNAFSYTPEMSSVRTEIVELRRMLSEYLPQIVEKDTQLSIDGRVLSNAIAPMMDRSLGSISRLKARGV